MARATYFSSSVPSLPNIRADGHSQGWVRAQEMLIRTVDALGAWQERVRDRRRLATLDDQMLRDIGVDRATAIHEAAKPFWVK